MHRKRTFLLILAAGLLYILLNSQLRLSISQYTVESETLPEGFDGFRIVQLSDLHGAEFGLGNRRLLRAVEALEPDLIAVTGDLVDREEDIQPMLDLMENLSESVPCCYVTGNHEWTLESTSELKNALKSRGVWVMDNRWQLITRHGDSIVLCGAADPNGPADMPGPAELVEEIRCEHPDDFLLLLGHRNDWVKKYPALDTDLILCGHGHGGLVRLPLLGGIFGTERNLFPEHTEGVIRTGHYAMVVSRGLGNSPGTIRVFNPPEIVVVNFKKI